MSTGWRRRCPSLSDIEAFTRRLLLLTVPFVLLVSTPSVGQVQTERKDGERIDLSSGTVEAIYRPRFKKPVGSTADEAARAFLRSDRRIGWSGDARTLRLSSRSLSSGGTHLTYQQHLGDVPVIDAVTKVSVNHRSELTFVMNGYDAGLPSNIDLDPVIDQNAADQIAATAVEGGDAAVRPATLAILPGDPARLVWQSTVWPETGGEWRVIVDAVSGEVVRSEDRTLNRSSSPRVRKPGRLVRRIAPASPAVHAEVLSTGKGMVFDPDPLATSGMPYAPPYTDDGDADNAELNAERRSVDLLDISQFADNKYRLAGPHVEVVGRRPFGVVNYDPPQELDPEQFNYTRGDERFEAVMAYYHIDKSQRWVQEIGFDNIQNLPIAVNPFGEGDADVSNYYLDQNFLALGGGSVDDAEDAFVIWHEYAHALLNANVPEFTSTFEGRAIHEGWSDYWAASYQRALYESGALPAGDWRRLFRWDGNNPPWTGRQLPEFKRYPDDLTGSSPHSDGLVLASALMGVWDLLGRNLTDQLNLQSHYYLTNKATMPDLAEAFIQADIDLYGGEHAAEIIGVFAERGFVDAESFLPFITHEPFGDTEQIGGVVEISAVVTGVISPIQRVSLVYSTGGDNTVADMTTTGDGVYSAQIALPSIPTIVEYHIIATDERNREVRFPDDAPTTEVRFQAGPDEEAPVIKHSPISQISVFGWPPVVIAEITDNIGIDSAYVEYTIDDVTMGTQIDGGRFVLSPDGDRYSGAFPELEGQIKGSEKVSYRLVSRDRATAANKSSLPTFEEPAFEFLVSPVGTVAYFDFEGSSGDVSTTGVWEHGTPSFGVEYAHSGSDAWATKLDGSYPDFPGAATLVLPSINLSGLTSAWLEFWHWYDTEHDGSAIPGSDTDATIWDGGVVQVSTDGGSSWSSITPEGGYDGTIPGGAGSPLENEEAFGGFSFGWRREIAVIPAGPDVQIRFVFAHDVSNDEESIAYAGWIIDDVSVRVDEPRDNESPVVLAEPPAESEAESGSPVGPEVAIRVNDNIGVSSVDVTYQYLGQAHQSSGTVRLAQSGTDAERFQGRIPIADGSTAPGTILTYDIRIADFDGNEVASPSQGGAFSIEYVFVARQDQLTAATAAGGWEQADEVWSISGNSYDGGPAALVLSPIDLPSDAADIRFELLHDYQLASGVRAHVKATMDKGRTWTTIEPINGYPASGVGFSGNGDDVLSVFSLASYAAQQVQIRLEFASDESLSGPEFWRIQSAFAVFKANGDRFTVPRSLTLHPNFPDPFQQSTTLSYTIPEPTIVNLAVFDVLGRRIAQIVDEPMEAGTYTRHWNASGMAGGTYFLRLQTKSGQAVETVSIIR
ncbi:T9SS type A sorting domain-containing protein [Bacteroidota bacterium]